jgi:hypothetical protein
MAKGCIKSPVIPFDVDVVYHLKSSIVNCDISESGMNGPPQRRRLALSIMETEGVMPVVQIVPMLSMIIPRLVQRVGTQNN